MRLNSEEKKLVEKSLKTTALLLAITALTILISPTENRSSIITAVLCISAICLHNIGKHNRPGSNAIASIIATGQERLLRDKDAASMIRAENLLRNFINGGAQIFDQAIDIASTVSVATKKI